MGLERTYYAHQFIFFTFFCFIRVVDVSFFYCTLNTQHCIVSYRVMCNFVYALREASLLLCSVYIAERKRLTNQF